MCGVCGYTGSDNKFLSPMIKHIRRRGPDQEGKFSKNNINLAATRLSIRDLNNGAQPFIHHDINFVTIFNGEIYNYEFLKKKILKKGYSIKTNCDTELIAPGYKFFGKEFFSLIEGMFAFAIYDLSTSNLILSRDRFGVKPLYYSILNNNLYFSSSAKSIYTLDFFKRKINLKNLQSVLSKRYVEASEHIFENIHQVNPGQIIKYKNNIISKETFIKENNFEGISGRNEELNKFLGNFFDNDIESFNLSDVDIGIMLSSGIDSNLLNEKLDSSIKKIFTLDFGESKFNESKIVSLENPKKINVCRFDIEAFEEIYDETIEAFDNPITDLVIFPTNFLMKNVSKEVKVAFSGEGADEIFGGYYYFDLIKKIKLLKKIPLSRLLCKSLSVIPHEILNFMFKYQGKLGPQGKRRLLTAINSGFNLNQDFENLISVFSLDEQKQLVNPDYFFNNNPKKEEFFDKDLYLKNFLSWLPNYTLYKTDQLSMHNSLEVRVPYLNNDFYKLFYQIINFKDSKLYDNKKILMNYIKYNSKIKIHKKIALQNYLDKKNKVFFVKLIEEKIKKNSLIFNILNYEIFNKIKRKYLIKPELILEKQLSSILILNSWLEKNA